MRIRSFIMPVVFLAFGAIFTACGGGDGETNGSGLPACPTDGTALTYATFGEAFFSTHCTSCHAAGTGVAGAESDPFETQAQIQAAIEDIYERAGGSNDSMPPSGGPTAEERQQLAEWLSCGAE